MFNNNILRSILGNVITRTDSYKIGHHEMYDPEIRKLGSYLESRGYDKNHSMPFSEYVSFGLQYILLSYLQGQVVTPEWIDDGELNFKERGHFPYKDRNPYNRKGWEYILKKHKGKLPISIKVAPEGTVLPLSNMSMWVESTDPNCIWLTNYLETHLAQVWYPITVATHSREWFKIWLAFLHKTGTPDQVYFKLHDFGCRGVTCMEQAAIGGCAHLTSFMGTDTSPGFRLANVVYGEPMAGYSINATEHSIMSSSNFEEGDLRAGEARMMSRLLDLNPTGPVACVSDTYDIYYACKHLWGEKFKQRILERDGVLVIRPDSSGHTKDGTYESTATVMQKLLRILANTFGVTTNSKGYKVLHPKVRLIWGDGIRMKSGVQLLKQTTDDGWSADNFAYGSGGGLLQDLNRDTLYMAFKACYGETDKKSFDVWKDPYHVGKASKRGRLKLVLNDSNKYETVSFDDPRPDQMIEVFRDGEILHQFSFQSIRERMRPSLEEAMLAYDVALKAFCSI